MEDECIHGLWPVSSCRICTPKLEPKEEIIFGFKAKFDSECAICDGSMNEGERIYKTSRDRYICQDCIGTL